MLPSSSQVAYPLTLSRLRAAAAYSFAFFSPLSRDNSKNSPRVNQSSRASICGTSFGLLNPHWRPCLFPDIITLSFKHHHHLLQTSSPSSSDIITFFFRHQHSHCSSTFSPQIATLPWLLKFPLLAPRSPMAPLRRRQWSSQASPNLGMFVLVR